MVTAIGEILFDHFTSYRRLGGTSFNLSYHLKCLGIPVRFITPVGNDPESKEIIETSAQYGFLHYKESARGMIELDRYCDLIYQFLIKDRSMGIQ